MGVVSRIEKDGTATPIMRLLPARKCRSKDMLDRQCQGVFGHSGLHWCYSGLGWLEQWTNKRGRRRFDMAHRSTPPGHKDYVSPEKMYPHSAMANSTHEMIERSRKALKVTSR